MKLLQELLLVTEVLREPDFNLDKAKRLAVIKMTVRNYLEEFAKGTPFTFHVYEPMWHPNPDRFNLAFDIEGEDTLDLGSVIDGDDDNEEIAKLRQKLAKRKKRKKDVVFSIINHLADHGHWKNGAKLLGYSKYGTVILNIKEKTADDMNTYVNLWFDNSQEQFGAGPEEYPL